MKEKQLKNQCDLLLDGLWNLFIMLFLFPGWIFELLVILMNKIYNKMLRLYKKTGWYDWEER